MPFGCFAYLHRSKALRKEGKFDETALKCVFLGFAFHLGHKGYLLGSLTLQKFYVATNCNFAEGEFPYRPTSSEVAKEFWGEDIDGRGVKPTRSVRRLKHGMLRETTPETLKSGWRKMMYLL